MSEKALRYNEGKPKLSYILHFPKTIELLAKIMEAGEIKYGKLNWKKGGNSDESYLDSAMRHIFKFANDDFFDEEYGTHHIGHAIWNLMAMFELNDHAIFDPTKIMEEIK